MRLLLRPLLRFYLAVSRTHRTLPFLDLLGVDCSTSVLCSSRRDLLLPRLVHSTARRPRSTHRDSFIDVSDVEVRPFDVLNAGLFHSTTTSVLDASRLHSSMLEASRLIFTTFCDAAVSAPALLRASCLDSSSTLFCRLGSWLPAL